jgi:hypothetical protein
MTVNISTALEIEGWMSSLELQWLSEQAVTHDVIVELGCYYGRSTRALADHCPGTVYAVDNWEMLWEKEKTFRKFQENLSSSKGRVVPVHADHMNIGQWLYKRPNMVFIDGDHRYDNVYHDIEYWLAWCAPGALFCGHDYTEGWDVDRAVRAFFPHAKLVPETSIWWEQT